MKIEQEKEVFRPITIILETEEEALMFKAFFGNVRGYGKVRQMAEVLWDAVPTKEPYKVDNYLVGSQIAQ